MSQRLEALSKYYEVVRHAEKATGIELRGAATSVKGVHRNIARALKERPWLLDPHVAVAFKCGAYAIELEACRGVAHNAALLEAELGRVTCG